MESASVHPRNGTFRVISVNAMTETVTNMMVSFAQVQYRLTLNCFRKQTELMGIMLDKAQLLLSPLMRKHICWLFKPPVIVPSCSAMINLGFQNNS